MRCSLCVYTARSQRVFTLDSVFTPKGETRTTRQAQRGLQTRRSQDRRGTTVLFIPFSTPIAGNQHRKRGLNFDCRAISERRQTTTLDSRQSRARVPHCLQRLPAIPRASARGRRALPAIPRRRAASCQSLPAIQKRCEVSTDDCRQSKRGTRHRLTIAGNPRDAAQLLGAANVRIPVGASSSATRARGCYRASQLATTALACSSSPREPSATVVSSST
jgi:hypothetical protein